MAEAVSNRKLDRKLVVVHHGAVAPEHPLVDAEGGQPLVDSDLLNLGNDSALDHLVLAPV